MPMIERARIEAAEGWHQQGLMAKSTGQLGFEVLRLGE
jgi:hypothetical protein